MQDRSKHLTDLMFAKHHHVTLRVIILTVLPLVILGVAGDFLDKTFSTKPLFFIIGLLTAFISTQVLIYVVFTKLTHSSHE